jgi:hypothetical protein
MTFTAANEDIVDIVETKLLDGHYDELLCDFRRRMDTALQALREYEEAVRQGEYL